MREIQVQKRALDRSERNAQIFAFNAGYDAATHDVCEWSEDEGGIFQTSCGESFEVTEGTPEENKFKFCCYCGGVLKQKLFEREEGHDN